MNLAIAFGSRGVGGALAHYEPGRKVLNLTKMRGAGCLAHELGHAFDHYLYNLNGFTADLFGCYLSMKFHKPGIHEELSDAMQQVYMAMARASDGKRESNYLKAAKDLDKGRKKAYYSSVPEMFARAFEAFVEDTLYKKGMVSQYLVHSTMKNEVYGDKQPYPTGEERARINDAMINLVETTKRIVGDKGFQMVQEYSSKKKEYTSYKENVIKIDKRTNEEIKENGGNTEIRTFPTVDSFFQRINSMNERIGFNKVITGDSEMEKMNYWTDKAQNNGLLGRIGLGKGFTGEGVCKKYKTRPDGVIVIDKTAKPRDILKATLEATIRSAAKKLGDEEELLIKTACIIAMSKEGLGTSEYKKDLGFAEIIKNNELAKVHLKKAYTLVEAIIK